MWTSSPTLSPSSGDFLFEVASLEGLTGVQGFLQFKRTIFRYVKVKLLGQITKSEGNEP